MTSVENVTHFLRSHRRALLAFYAASAMMRTRRCPAGLQPEAATRGSGQQPFDDSAPAANLLDIAKIYRTSKPARIAIFAIANHDVPLIAPISDRTPILLHKQITQPGSVFL